jgi:restriction endonuclease S subunit
LANIEVPLPSLADQRSFEAICDQVDQLAESHAATEPELDALLPSVLDRAFSDSLLSPALPSTSRPDAARK